MTWVFIVIAGIIALCLFCSCVGGVAYFMFGDRLGGALGLRADPTAGCEEALLGAPKYDAEQAGDPATHRAQAAHYREAANKATDPVIESAIRELARVVDMYALAVAAYNTKKSAGTVTTADLDVLSGEVDKKAEAYGKVLNLCREAGFK
ncbi:hypothetical protein ACWDV4_23885 [Micromonospora sp. NPDC003197]